MSTKGSKTLQNPIQDAWAETLQHALGDDFRVVYSTPKQPLKTPDKIDTSKLSTDEKHQLMKAWMSIESNRFNMKLHGVNWKAVD